MPIRYAIEPGLSSEAFIDILRRATLSERRPVDNPECIAGMLKHADLIITARDDAGALVGVARTVTDFHYAAYLSDLAVDQRLQRQGIGRELIAATARELRPTCKLILLSAPGAATYYSRIGFSQHPSAWVLAFPFDLRG
jgi:predicted N-acetyltransferase YhbS